MTQRYFDIQRRIENENRSLEVLRHIEHDLSALRGAERENVAALLELNAAKITAALERLARYRRELSEVEEGEPRWV